MPLDPIGRRGGPAVRLALTRGKRTLETNGPPCVHPCYGGASAARLQSSGSWLGRRAGTRRALGWGLIASFLEWSRIAPPMSGFNASTDREWAAYLPACPGMERSVGVDLIRNLSEPVSRRLKSHAMRMPSLLVVPFALAISTALALSSNHVQHAPLTALFYGYSIVVPVGVGVYWWLRRPDSGMGTLLYVLGILFAIASWQSSDNSVVYTIGVAANAPLTVLLFALPLAYPGGRLDTRVDRLLIGSLAVVLMLVTGLGCCRRVKSPAACHSCRALPYVRPMRSRY